MYASVAQLRAYLKQIKESEDNEALLTSVLTRATDMVRNSLRALLPDKAFDFTLIAEARIVSGFPTASLSIPAHTIGSVSLVETESGSSPLSYTSLLATEWSEDADGRLYRPGGWTSARYRITASWGYGTTIPPAIEELTLELAVNLWRAKDKGGYSEIVGVESSGGAIRVVSGLNSQQRQILNDLASQLWQVSI